jgi:ubiquinone/menaquinone biosynthesis C-methylase UbiE
MSLRLYIFNDFQIHYYSIRFCLQNVNDQNLNILNFNRVKDNNYPLRCFNFVLKCFSSKLLFHETKLIFKLNIN